VVRCVSSSRGQLAAAEMRAPVRRTATDGRMGTTAAEGSSESTHANSRGRQRHLWNSGVCSTFFIHADMKSMGVNFNIQNEITINNYYLYLQKNTIIDL